MRRDQATRPLADAIRDHQHREALVTEAITEHLERVVALGGFVEGATDQALDRFRVVAGD